MNMLKIVAVPMHKEGRKFVAIFAAIAIILGFIWQPLFLGCITLGILSGLAGSVTMRLLWRLHIIKYLKEKQLRFAHRKDKS